MDKQAILQRVKSLGLLAVIRGPSEALTLKMVDALVAGGVKGIEITYSTPNAPAVVRALADKYGDEILLGMGTLTEPSQAQEAKQAGANYLVSPICDPELVTAMVASGLSVMAGAVAVGAGSELCPRNLAEAGEFGAISENARQFCEAVEKARPKK